ncbi:Glycosyl hydrolases family 38 N-terminal domain-containing protein [Kaistia soli DSM 19436]|uniref:Glycosyl hydrolases family 38 N-terminal domain-containing protein n=1 Tax=Kaistia soli DSM 19436 TaxID=1122133 RepID=A0A1M5IJV8_9HYPH|nr:glycoside hydrolase family 38 C-terminal domain-containing protein [Kaistia soli]SHG28073.1 Glycosyl hydrolases family 38 N-terminal domain-containing protein [Kaistia soli DSM 19436]
MPAIKTIYVCNHSHTDIGFTDYQDVCFRQHADFIRQALDLIEATEDYPEEARYSWTCETTGPLLRYLRSAGPDELRRFQHWHHAGRIDVAAMNYNLTPLLNVEQMHRSLYPLRALRDEFGLTVESAMQDDVNGISWLFADLLAELGVWFYSAAINPIRGARPKPFPGAFRWQGPSGREVLAWNGYHYLFGRSQAGLGNFELVDRLLPRWVSGLEADPTYPYDFLYCEATHPVRVDNGPPDRRMADFVKRWNEEDRPYRMAFKTVTEFGRLLEAEHGATLGMQRGDWTDHWMDGPGSSAYETGINRQAHEILGAAEAIEAWLRSEDRDRYDAVRAAHDYEQAILFDEHTWGAYSSIEAPDSLFTKAQWNRKASFAYTAVMEGHDRLAGAARALAAPLGTPGPEGVFNLGDLAPEEAFKPSGIEDVLVINTLPWDRDVIVEEPEPRGGAAPAGMLDCFFNRRSGWGGNRPVPPIRRVAGRVPAMGFAFLPLSTAPAGSDLRAGPGFIENAHYRIEIDPEGGGLKGFLDKDLGHDFAGRYEGWRPGEYVYEVVESDKGRDAIASFDFSNPDFFTGFKDTPWRRSRASEVVIEEAVVENGRASITVRIQAGGVASAAVTYALDSGVKQLAVDWMLDKLAHEAPEAVFIAFPFNLGAPRFMLDMNGIPSEPNIDQLDGAAKDWYPVQRWVDVGDGARGVTVVPLDAPLVHLGGITTGKWARTLTPEGPTIMSWALNNHWMVNFKASQDGRIPLRYRLTTHEGDVDPATAARFAAEASMPPVVLRDIAPTGPRSGSFYAIDPAAPILATAKSGEAPGWIALRLQNLAKAPTLATIRFAKAPAEARRSDPIEHPGEPLAVSGTSLAIDLDPLATATILVRFGEG